MSKKNNQLQNLKKKNNKRISKKAGLPPGTPVHIGKDSSSLISLELIIYNTESVRLKKISSAKECEEFLGNDHICWLHVDGVHDIDTLNQIGEVFGLHPLVLEDIANTQHRPKYEDMGNYIFFTLKHLEYKNNNSEINYEQISFILGNKFVISFREKPDNLFINIKERLLNGISKARSRNADYLTYLMVDATVDSYYQIIETLEDKIENLEDNVINSFRNFSFSEIQSARRELILLLKSVFPLREAISKILRRETQLVHDSTIVFFSDIYDHTIHIIESVESQRDILSGLLEIYMSATSNRMNSIMKVLTIIATIFIPITFIAGVYGMNFKYFPEINWEWGYAFFWLICLICAALMIIYFRKKKWL